MEYFLNSCVLSEFWYTFRILAKRFSVPVLASSTSTHIVLTRSQRKKNFSQLNLHLIQVNRGPRRAGGCHSMGRCPGGTRLHHHKRLGGGNSSLSRWSTLELPPALPAPASAFQPHVILPHLSRGQCPQPHVAA